MTKELILNPTEKDFDRAKKMRQGSSAQMEANINRIKDPFKVANRGVAYFTHYRYGDSWMFRNRLKALKASEELTEAFEHSMALIRKEYEKQDRLRAESKRLREFPSVSLFNNKIIDKVSKMTRNQILNQLYLNKQYFGDEIKIKSVAFKFHHWPNWGSTHIPCHIVIQFEHLSGYFFRDLGYALTYDLKFEGDNAIIYKDNGRKFAQFGKKDTITLKENYEVIKNFKG